jgi:hypothetical protein
MKYTHAASTPGQVEQRRKAGQELKAMQRTSPEIKLTGSIDMSLED